MRTTLTLDDDLAGLLRQRARELGIPFKEVLNRTIRAGLGEAARSKRGPIPKTIPHSFGFMPGIDLDKLNQLVDELEAEAFVESWALVKKSSRAKRGRVPSEQSTVSPGAKRRASSEGASPKDGTSPKDQTSDRT